MKSVWSFDEERDNVVRCVMLMGLPGRRRGRHKTRWKDAVARDLEVVGLEEEWANDR